MIHRSAAGAGGSLGARAKSLPSSSLSQRATTAPASQANLARDGWVSSRASSSSYSCGSGDEADPATPTLSNILKDTNKLGATALPRSPEDFLRPLLHGSKAIRGKASSYLAALAESSTSASHFQQHILRMFARGMVDTAKVARVIQDPGSGLSDICIDTGCSMWLKHLKSQEADAPDSSPNSPIIQPSSDSSKSPFHPGGGGGGWKRLRLRVLGASCFKKAAASKDDNYLPDRSSEVSPLHAKALSLMLSVMLSASSSCLTECLSHAGSSSSTEPGLTPTALSNTAQAAVNTGKAVLFGMLQAPCVTAHGSGLASHTSSGLAAQLSGQVSQIGGPVSHSSSGLVSHASGLVSHASGLVSHASGGKAAQLAGSAAGKLSSFGSGQVATALQQTTIAEAGEGVLGLGGAAATNIMKALRSDSKKLLPCDELGSWASVSMDAAGSVLELFVESVEKVDKEGRAVCGSSLGRCNSLPHCLQPLVDKCGDTVKEGTMQSIKSCRQ